LNPPDKDDMTVSCSTDQDRAESEASVWLVRLADAQGDAGLLASFEAWRAASPINARSWERARLAYELIGKREPRHRVHLQPNVERRSIRWPLPPPRPAVSAGRRAGDRVWRSRRFTPRRMLASVAAAACVALLVATFLPGLLIRLQADVVTATAELRTITLPDGSRVDLGPESAIDMTFADGKRQVRLLKGSAFFDVAPDEGRPFRVATVNALVSVLGTAFEVGYVDDNTLVAVQHGRVGVEDPHTEPRRSNTLGAGEWTRVLASGGAQRGKLKADEVASWRQGRLVALNRPAGEVVDDLRHYYPGVILVQSQAFARRQVSGIYDLADPRRTLRDLASSHGARVREVSDWLLIITAGDE